MEREVFIDVGFVTEYWIVNQKQPSVKINISGDKKRKQFCDLVTNAVEKKGIYEDFIGKMYIASIAFTATNNSCIIYTSSSTGEDGKKITFNDNTTLSEIFEIKKKSPKTKWKYDGSVDDLIEDTKYKITVNFCNK